MEMMMRPTSSSSASTSASAPNAAHAPVPATETPLPSLSAAAFTGASHNALAPSPASTELIAHEAAHVVQQQRGGAASPFADMY